MSTRYRHNIIDTVTFDNLVDVEASINSFKLFCRPSRRGRPIRTGTRVVNFNGLIINVRIGESCIGAGTWGITTTLTSESGKRLTLQKIAQLHIERREKGCAL